MAHFAELDTHSRVLQVIVVNNEDILDKNGNESEEVGVAFCRALFGENTNWVQTSYNGSFRKNYAGIGYTYDPLRDAFIPPRPYLSWRLNAGTLSWDPPVPLPDDGNEYTWDELNRQWIEVE